MSMSLLDDARAATTPDAAEDTPPDEGTTREQGGATASLTTRETTVSIGGEPVDVSDPDTIQPTDDGGSWLSGTDGYGRPRGTDALELRQIVQTSPMQSIANAVASQVTGGDLAFEADEEAMEALSPSEQAAVEDFREILRDILRGPHGQGLSLDQLISAAVEDMLGVGQAAWQLLGSESGTVPVAQFNQLDPLTIRVNIDRHGVWGDPPYWQAQSPASGGTLTSMGGASPTPLAKDELVLLDYPHGTRSYRTYPVSPAWQVKEWLEIMANSTTHHNRFYADDEVPPGLLQVIGASPSTVETIKEKLEQASGDPRDVPVVGGESAANWLDMGGTAINLDIIQEQQFFFEMCLGAVGLGRAEVGLIEDVNRSNGEIEATRVFKRVTGPFIDQFEKAFLKVARQFDVFTDTGQPFTPTLEYTDPREQQAKEERLRKAFQAGTVSYKEYKRKTGDGDLATDDERFTVTVGGEEINYGEHPRWVAQALLSDAGEGVDVDGEPGSEDDDDAEGEA